MQTWTAGYYEQIVQYLHDAGIYVGAVNPKLIKDAKFDVLATEMAFGLINGSELVNYTVADAQSIDPADFNIDSNVQFL